MAPAYPKKAPVKPSQPMRQLHWGKLPDMKVKGTLWEKEVDDSKVAIDKDELESLFATKQPAKAGGADGEKKEDKKKKGPEMANLLDAKTSQNTGIARARIKQTDAELAETLRTGGDAMDADTLTSLLKILPTEENLEAVRDYDGPEESLSQAEQFFTPLMKSHELHTSLHTSRRPRSSCAPWGRFRGTSCGSSACSSAPPSTRRSPRSPSRSRSSRRPSRRFALRRRSRRCCR